MRPPSEGRVPGTSPFGGTPSPHGGNGRERRGAAILTVRVVWGALSASDGAVVVAGRFRGSCFPQNPSRARERVPTREDRKSTLDLSTGTHSQALCIV